MTSPGEAGRDDSSSPGRGGGPPKAGGGVDCDLAQPLHPAAAASPPPGGFAAASTIAVRRSRFRRMPKPNARVRFDERPAFLLRTRPRAACRCLRSAARAGRSRPAPRPAPSAASPRRPARPAPLHRRPRACVASSTCRRAHSVGREHAGRAGGSSRAPSRALRRLGRHAGRRRRRNIEACSG
jgi:hypothetical protein